MPVHFLDRVHRPASGPVAVGIVLEVSLEDGFDHDLGGSLNHTIKNGRNAKRSSPPVALGIIIRRTGSGRYVFETSSARKPANHASRPCFSMRANVIPSTPGAPALRRASR